MLIVSGAWVVVAQSSHHYPLLLEWPQHFEGAGRLALVAVALLAADAVVDRLRA